MATFYSEPHAQLRMAQRGVNEQEVQQALWSGRANHEKHETRSGSFWAPVPGKPKLFVLYRPSNGDDFVITVSPRSRSKS
jgi:hypothetical protein